MTTGTEHKGIDYELTYEVVGSDNLYDGTPVPEIEVTEVYDDTNGHDVRLADLDEDQKQHFDQVCFNDAQEGRYDD